MHVERDDSPMLYPYGDSLAPSWRLAKISPFPTSLSPTSRNFSRKSYALAGLDLWFILRDASLRWPILMLTRSPFLPAKSATHSWHSLLLSWCYRSRSLVNKRQMILRGWERMVLTKLGDTEIEAASFVDGDSHCISWSLRQCQGWT